MGTTWDGSYGVGQEMAALEVIQSNLIAQVAGPVTNTTGGTRKGNNAAGTKSTSNPVSTGPATEADKVGAGFVITIVLVCFIGMVWWMIV